MGLRVALLTTEYGPSTEGGAGIYAEHLASALRKSNVDVEVFAPESSTGVRTRTPHLLPFWWGLAARLRERAGAQPFDIVHSNGIAGLPVMRSPRSEGRVATIHHVTRELLSADLAGIRRRFVDLRGESGITPLAEAYLVRQADLVIAVSRATSDSLREHYRGTATKTVTIHNGLPSIRTEHVTDADVAAFRGRFSKSGEALVLAVGRLEHRKGFDILLRAFAGVRMRGRWPRLAIVGAGPVAKYVALAHQLGCADRVAFTGRLSDRDLATAYRACDVFVASSRQEGFGFVALEAMAAGKPVVATRTGAVLDGLIDDTCGAVVDIGDIEALRGRIEELLRDPTRAAAIGQQNRIRVGNLSWHETAQATIKAYQLSMEYRERRR